MLNKMKSTFGGKKYLPIIIAIAVVGLGVGVYSVSRGPEQTNISTQEGEKVTETNEDENGGFVGSLKDALKSGATMKCGWKDDAGNYSETYIKTNKIYHKMVAEGRTGYMIAKDKCVWSWSGESNQGMKICYDEDIMEDGELPTEGGVNTQGYEFNCIPSMVADSVFEAPSDISFIDPMDLIPEGMDIEIPAM
ncbi:hypothetical protein KKB40_04940 [Patescibacteria group bacterium]|nr:hypothetical protein [Patescibacteria group bacterium]